ncbi:MAG TPA: HDIG domain-containing protein [Vicinamibacteria bacterium]|nr:HDIG domain-containing protein [Vicinamibacteria bacterium]
MSVENGSKAKKEKRETSRRGRKGFRRRDFFDLAYSSPWPWVGLFLGATTALLTPGLIYRVQPSELGQIATVTVRAPHDFSYEDEVTTAARREEAAQAVLEVYHFNDAATTDARNRIASAFEAGRASVAALESLKGEELESALAELMGVLRERLGVTVGEKDLEFLLDKEFSIEVEQVLTRAVTNVLARDIVGNKERLLASGRPIRRRRDVAKTTQIRRDFSNVLTTEEAHELLQVQMASLSDLRQAEWRALSELGSRLIEPTLRFDYAETERLRAQAREEVDPVYFHVRRGKTIVRAGDEITPNVLRQLEFLAKETSHWGLAGLIGAALLAGVLLFVQWYLLRPVRVGDAWRRQSFAMVGLVVVGHLAFARVTFFVARLFAEQMIMVPFNNASSYFYAVPFAAVAVLVLLLEHTPTALLASVIFGVALGIMTGNLQIAIFSLVSCLAAILGLFQYKRRTALFKLGLLVGSVNFVTVLAIDLLTGRYFPPSTFSFDLFCAFVGGASVSVVVSFLLPAFELLFHRTTDIRLLELSNQNVPVLRRLALEAPGTYHHSMVVGSLAEAAAESIGANSVFCRTAAMYHDIGKLTKINYFVENQIGPNKHDNLSPRMSALIIGSHVKEGIEMAKEMNLPQEIIDIIPQHHGTKLITYFYEKAKVNQDPALGAVTEEEYRYPGPKPQTKEAGIIMLADAVEAASRTLDDPSPARLKGLIRQIIDYVFLDGQLNECALTLRDLEKIAQSFLRVLMGIHHHRVSYPGFDFEKQVEPVVLQNSR